MAIGRFLYSRGAADSLRQSRSLLCSAQKRQRGKKLRFLLMPAPVSFRPLTSRSAVYSRYWVMQ